MAETTKFDSVHDAHRYFAAQLHGLVWDLLEREDRDESQSTLMLSAAHASLYHWLQVGTVANKQRGEWLVARVQTVLGNQEAAAQHAHRALKLVEAHRDEMEDFDLAFAHEAVARAHSLAGESDMAEQSIARARAAGEAIGDAEDREIFFQELEGGDWYGIAVA